MMVAAVDPGTTQSAYLTWDGARISAAVIMPNEALAEMFRNGETKQSLPLVIESVESFGMAVGMEVFRAVRWSGYFEALWYPRQVVFMPRRVVKQHLCHTARATDANIRQALIDRFGGQEKAIGKKATPGPLYALKSHLWSAFALALTFHDTHRNDPEQIRPGVVPDF